jgi:hypothetical protein
MLPIARLMSWAGPADESMIGDDLYEDIRERAPFKAEEGKKYEIILAPFMETKAAAMEILSMLTEIPLDDEKTRRDAFDVARTVIGRFINAAILKAQICFAKGDIRGQEEASRASIGLLEALALLLGGHEDYSLLHSLERLKTETETNPNFEITLKNNAECEYNRSHIYENTLYLYLPEARIWLNAALEAAKAGKPIDKNSALAEMQKNRSVYFETPLAEMKRESAPLAEVATRAKEILAGF